MYKFIWLVPLLPLAGAAINGIFGRWFRFPEKLVGGIAVATVALSFLISVAAIYSYGFSGNALWPNPYVSTQTAFTWIPGGAVRTTMGESTQGPETTISIVNQQVTIGSSHGSLLNIDWSYQLDSLSAVFMLIITGVGLCIFVFATGYMHDDPGFYRFFAYMGLFMFSMLVLVMGSNFVMMFVGWEGVGLCSYLLIGYYFNREEAANASRKAFITNRIGDFGFILAIFAVIATFGSAQYTSVIQKAAGYPVEALGHWGLMSWIALGLMIGACGKSAQFPLHVWLPDAMAGPTPVSALIHAATMVTAGLYMLTRTNVIFQHSQTMMLVVAVVGAFTAIFAATIGITQNDIKKVLAYSTVSQLGFMFLAGWLAICGIIPFSGFWSKDEILWRTASTSVVPIGWLLWIVGVIAATCTAFYMTRLVAMTFWGKEKFLDAPHDHTPEHEVHDHDHETPTHHTHIPHESPASMWVPLAVLAVLATVGGFVGISSAFTGGQHVGGRMNIVNFLDPIIWNPTTRFFGTHHVVDSYGKQPEFKEAHVELSVLTTEPLHVELPPPPYGQEGFNLAHMVESAVHSEALTEWVFIIISLLVAGLGITLGWLFYVKNPRLPDIWASRLRPLYQASYNKYWVDEFYGWAITRRTMYAARAVFAFDSKVVDGAVNGSAWLTKGFSRAVGGVDKYFVDGLVNAVAAVIIRLLSPLLRAAQTGFTQNYALAMVLGLLVAVAIFFAGDIAAAVRSIFALFM